MADLVSNLEKLSRQDNYTRAELQQAAAGLNLRDSQTLELFNKLLRQSIVNNDDRLALMCRYILEDILLAQKQKSLGQEIGMYNRYSELIALFKFMNLSIRGLTEITNLIKENLVSAIKVGIGVKNKFQEVLNSYDDFLMEGKIAEALANAIVSCKQKIDISNESFAGKGLSLTLGKFLNDYIQFSFSTSEHATGSLERIEYFKVNENAKALSEGNKKILLESIRIYDWLRYGGAEDKEVDSEETLNLQAGYIKSENFQLPEEILQPSQGKNIGQPLNLPPVVPAPRNAPATRTIQEIVRGQPRNNNVGLAAANAVQKPQTQNPPVMPKRPVSPLPSMQAGLRIGVPENYAVPQKPNPVQNNQQQNIDKKLEDLEKRIDGKTINH